MKWLCGVAVTAFAFLSAAGLGPARGASPQPGEDSAALPSAAVSQARGEGALRAIEVSRPPSGASRRDADRNRLSDDLDARLAALAPGETVDVIVTFSGPGNAASAMASVGAFSVTQEYSLIPGFAATVSAAQARALAAMPGVRRVDADRVMHAYMENARRDFGVDLPDGTPALPAGLTGAGIVVCVVDTGIWPLHEHFLAETAFVDLNTTKVAKFADFIGEGGTGETLDGTLAHDEHYHGTTVSSIAAGDGTSVPELDGGRPDLAWPLRGIARDATLWGAQVLQPDFFGNATGPSSGVVAGIDWCVAEALADGVIDKLVINLSLGDPGADCEGDPVAAAVDAAYALGAVVIAAAGNSGDDDETMGPPACAAGAFPVAAAADHSLPFTPGLGGSEDFGRFVAPWSSRGAALERGVAGPGMTIAAGFNATTDVFNAGCTPGQPGCYILASGTSFAAPFVAGLAALLREADPLLGPEEIYGILRDSSVPWGAEVNPNAVAGAGMVDGFAAIETAQGGTACIDYSPSVTPAYAKVTGSVADSGSIQFPVWIVDPAQPLAITLSIDGVAVGGVWDPDLELTLRDANGDPYEIEILPGLTIPVEGTTSTCPAGLICGSVGAQETIAVALPPAPGEPIPDPASPTPNYFIEVYPFSGLPNGGKGGTFTLEFSNAYTDQAVGPDPDRCVFAAHAGPDQQVIDADDDGDEQVFLDASASIGASSYVWTAPGVAIPDGETSSAFFPIGVHKVTLTISNGTHVSQDSLQVTVTDLTPNIPPETDDTAAVGDQDAASIAITLSGSDVDGNVASFAVDNLPNPSHGVLYEDPGLTNPVLAGTDYAASANQRTIHFVPAAGWFGVTAFTYAARDDSGADDPSPATATLTVNEVLPLGGTVSGVFTHFVACINRTTGQTIPVPLQGATAWDCEAAGLLSQPGDTIDMLVRGTDQ